MPPISHKFIEKLRKEVAEYDAWLGSTEPQEDGTAKPDDLKALYSKGYSIYQKSLALHQAVAADEPTNTDEFDELRQDVNKFNYWLATSVNQTNSEDLQVIFTRANAIYLKALSLYRSAGTESGNGSQDPPDDEHASLSGS